MNNICIINKSEINIINLIFENNTFELNNIIYNFDIINKDKILIWKNEKDINTYYTEDSYLYFLDISKKKSIKKIFLIHNEWLDQAIIDNDKMHLKRIKDKDQYGDILFENNKLIIFWNYWGKEIYIRIDKFTYMQESYISQKIINNLNHKLIHIFIHVTMIENWEFILNELIISIKKSGLYYITNTIHLGILGDIKNLQNDYFKNNILNDNKFNIIYIDSRTYLYEIHTINSIKSFLETEEKEEVYILYIHTKGVRRAGNENVTNSWREMMSYFLIDKYMECLENLSYYDTIGNNIVNLYCDTNSDNFVNNSHTLHYSGNFWWSKKTYINKLNYLKLNLTNNSSNTRYQAENWILSNYPDCKIGILFQDDTNTHPYHRYVFNYYKNMKVICKEYK